MSWDGASGIKSAGSRYVARASSRQVFQRGVSVGMEFAAIDFETANEQHSSACALGIVVVEGKRITTKSSWLIRPPDLRFNSLNVSLHGITERDVVREPTFDQLWSDIGKYVNGKTVIAHNASFDLSVLRSLLDLYGIAYPELRYYCTCVLSRRVWPALNNHKLTTVAAHLGIAFQHHDASEDAAACAQIALACCEKSGVADLTSLGTKLGVSPHQLYVGRARPRAGPLVEAHARVTAQILESEELPVGAAYLESNYDVGMLDEGPYPEHLKMRIAGGGGHLSNGESADVLRRLVHRRMKWIALSHLSEENNTPETALEAHRKAIGRDLPIHVASRYTVSASWEV